MNDVPVIKVTATRQEPDYDCPWQSNRAGRGSGSGVALAGRRVLTGAHVVADATFVEVQNTNDPRRYEARVTAVSHDCDLALLNVEDKRFWQGLSPLTFANSPPRLANATRLCSVSSGGSLTGRPCSSCHRHH